MSIDDIYNDPKYFSYDKKKARCKTCKWKDCSERRGWCFPCDECRGSTSTLVEPTKDYYEEVKEKNV